VNTAAGPLIASAGWLKVPDTDLKIGVRSGKERNWKTQ